MTPIRIRGLQFKVCHLLESCAVHAVVLVDNTLIVIGGEPDFHTVDIVENCMIIFTRSGAAEGRGA